MKKAFTLIELLIVVAIIAILAAIAVPNFLEAQTRSKVSRVKAELRTLATAMDSYSVDNGSPPPEAGSGPGTGVFAPLTIDGKPGQTGILTPSISTPVAYMTSFLFIDPFMTSEAAERPDVRLYTYKAYKWEWPKSATPRDDSQPIYYNEGPALNGAKFQQLYGQWRLFSIGPDRQWDNKWGAPNISSPASVGLPYDPTNGTVSLGSIVRSQKYTEQQLWAPVAGQ
ncbi:MAG: prepilin-type N-terminal cleavage/methylation domain-containing protein [bacterium]